MKRRDWSMINGAQLRAYVKDAARLVAFAEQNNIPMFAAALAGVSFIRNALAKMGGHPEWWFRLITSTKANPLEDFTIIDPSEPDPDQKD